MPWLVKCAALPMDGSYQTCELIIITAHLKSHCHEYAELHFSLILQRQKVRLKEASHWKGITPSGLLSSLSYIQDVEQGSRETPSTSPYFFPVQREPGLSHDAPGCIQRQTFVKKTVWWCTCVQTALKKKNHWNGFTFMLNRINTSPRRMASDRPLSKSGKPECPTSMIHDQNTRVHAWSLIPKQIQGTS